jgi:hypothetical protein
MIQTSTMTASLVVRVSAWNWGAVGSCSSGGRSTKTFSASSQPVQRARTKANGAAWRRMEISFRVEISQASP